MSKHENEDEFLQKINRHLDEKEQGLPADVLSQLRQRRQMALDQMSGKTGTSPESWLSRLVYGSSGGSATALRPMGMAVAMMSVFAVVIGLTFMHTGDTGSTDPLVDLPLLSASEEFELYEELEFYQWLEFEDRTG